MKNYLTQTSILAFVFSLTILLAPTMALAESVTFSDYLQTKNNPDGHISEISKNINLSESADHEVKVYYRSDSGSQQLYEEFNVYLDGSLLGTATDPNEGDDFEEKNLGTNYLQSGDHTLRVEHAYDYSNKGDQSVYPLEVSFTSQDTNSAPTADAGSDKEVFENNSVNLSGSASDPDGDSMTYNWTCNGGSLSDANTLSPTFNAPSVSQDTTYICTLTVQDSNGAEDSDNTNVFVKNETEDTNSAPTADAGSDKEVFENNSVTLNGSANDPNGDSMTYDWTCNGGSLSDANTLSPTFNAPSVSQDTTYICTLTVQDSNGAEDSDNVNILTKNETQNSNNAPTADAGSDKQIYENNSVNLSGSASDPDGDSMTYDWTCNGGSVSNSNTLSPTFNAPSVSSHTTYNCTLEVTDSEGLSDSDNVNVLVKNRTQNSNNYPFNNAGSDKQINEGQQVYLDGSASDPDGDSLSNRWSCSGGSLSNRYSLSPTFYAPQVSSDTSYICTLRTTDNEGLTTSDSTRILVLNTNQYTNNNQTINDPRVSTRSADDIEVNSAQLRGTLNSLGGDSNTEVWFEWGENTSYGDRTSRMTRNTTGSFSWNLNDLEEDTTYHFRAVARNDDGTDYGFDSTFTTNEEVEDNQAPTVSAGSDKDIFENQYTALNGSASDSDGSIVSQSWNCTRGNVISPNQANTTFVAPSVNVDTSVNCAFSATDNDGQTSSDSITILVRNSVTTISQPVTTTAQEGFVTIEKSARNITRGNDEWNTESIEAYFSDEIEFRITISSNTDEVLTDIRVRDNMPSGLSYQGNLTIDGEETTNITEEEINIGDLSPGETRTIIFSAQVNEEDNFENESGNISNIAIASNDTSSSSDSAAIQIAEEAGFFAAALGGIFGGYSDMTFTDFFLSALLIAFLVGIYFAILWLQRVREREKVQVQNSNGNEAN